MCKNLEFDECRNIGGAGDGCAGSPCKSLLAQNLAGEWVKLESVSSRAHEWQYGKLFLKRRGMVCDWFVALQAGSVSNTSLFVWRDYQVFVCFSMLHTSNIERAYGCGAQLYFAQVINAKNENKDIDTTVYTLARQTDSGPTGTWSGTDV